MSMTCEIALTTNQLAALMRGMLCQDKMPKISEKTNLPKAYGVKTVNLQIKTKLYTASTW